MYSTEAPSGSGPHSKIKHNENIRIESDAQNENENRQKLTEIDSLQMAGDHSSTTSACTYF